MKEYKKSVRTKFLQLRRDLSQEQIQIISSKIWNAIYDTKEFKEASVVGTYVHFQNEIQTIDAIQRMLNMDKKVAVPKVFKENKEMYFYQIASLQDLEAGVWGILEPNPEKTQFLPYSEIDLMIVPGVAFDLQGYRVGYGGGYYDRYLSQDPSVYKVGVCCDFQIVHRLEHQTYDIPVDTIVTESRMYPIADKKRGENENKSK